MSHTEPIKFPFLKISQSEADFKASISKPALVLNINGSPRDELSSVAKWINSKGRVSLEEIQRESNKLIKL